MIESARDVLARVLRKQFPGIGTDAAEVSDIQIAALTAAGLAVVPIEPTADMISASLRNDDPRDEQTWATMLAARPQP